jgi:hypothetical protein
MRTRYLFILLWVAALLIACGGDEPVAVTELPQATEMPTREPTKPAEPTAQPEPTNQPDPTAEPEPTAEPTVAASAEPEQTGIDLPELVRIDAGGISLRLPTGYSVQVLGDTAELAPPDAISPQDGAFSVSGGPYLEDETFESLQADIGSLLSNFSEVSDPQPFDSSVGEAFSIDFAHEQDGQAVAGRVILIDQLTQGAAMVGFASPEAWAALSETFNAIARTVEFFEPVVVAAEIATDETTEDGSTTSSGQGDSGEPPATAPVFVGDGEPGMACFSARGDGLTCLHADGTWEQITEDNSQIGNDYVVAMTECNGAILMAHISGLARYDGSKWQAYNDGWGVSTADDIACDANGGIWVAHFQGVSYFDGNGWTTFSADDVLGGETLVYDVEISADGTVWVLTSGSIARYDGSEWTTYTETDGLDGTYFFDALTVDAKGVVWAAHSDGLLYFEAGVWNEISSPSYLSPEGIVATADGGKWVGTFNDGIVIFNGATTTRVDRANDGLSSDAINALALDDSGRIWVGTGYGLNVWTGSEWIVYDMDSSDLMNNAVESIAIVGGGPALPARIDKENGGLVGTVTEGGLPIAETRVELCVEAIYSRFKGATPCEGQTLAFQTTTDSEGAFRFEDLPVGNYLIVVETSDSWAKMTSEFGFGSEFAPVAEGETTDVGELMIETEE